MQWNYYWNFTVTACNPTYLLTPWCRILFEKLIVTQLVKKYPAFLRNPKVHHRVHKSPPLDPILSQPYPVRPIDPYLPKVHLNVILPPTPRHFETFRNRKIFTVRGCRPHAQPSSWRTTPCRLSATAYSIYSQLPSAAGGLNSELYEYEWPISNFGPLTSMGLQRPM
jgi:hypothetical protein